MSPIRHISPALLSAILALSVTVAACDAPTGDPTVATSPPSQREPIVDDPRIGEGLPAEVRFAGLEHNRLTLLMLRQARGRGMRRLAMQSPCEVIVSGLSSESQRTAVLAGIPGRGNELTTILRAFMSTHRECRGRIARPPLSAFIGDAGVTASVHRDSVLTDAPLQIIEQMLGRIDAAESVAEITAAFDAAAASATTLGAIDALAVQAAVSQGQGSAVLWGPGGEAWYEVDSPIAAQSLFRASARGSGFLRETVEAILADGAGCLSGLAFLRRLPIVQDPRLLLGACGLVAAGGTVMYGYSLFHEE